MYVSETKKYDEKAKRHISSYITDLDSALNDIPEDAEIKEYVDLICQQDRYFLKSKNSVVNMAYLINNTIKDEKGRTGLKVLDCADIPEIETKLQSNKNLF